MIKVCCHSDCCLDDMIILKLFQIERQHKAIGPTFTNILFELRELPIVPDIRNVPGNKVA